MFNILLMQGHMDKISILHVLVHRLNRSQMLHYSYNANTMERGDCFIASAIHVGHLEMTNTTGVEG